MKKVKAIKTFFEKNTPICFLGFDSFFTRIKNHLSQINKDQLSRLGEMGFSHKIDVYLSKYAIANYYYKNPFTILLKAVKELNECSDTWSVSLYSDNAVELKTAHSTHISIGQSGKEPNEFTVSGQLCEQMLKDALTADRLVADLIITVMQLRNLSAVHYFKAINFSSVNEETLPCTIADKLVYSRRFSISSHDANASEEELEKIMLFFASLKNYRISVNFDFSGSVRNFSAGMNFTQRLNDMLQSVAACAEYMLQANDKFSGLFSKKFTFYFQDTNCNSAVTRKMVIDQYVQVQDVHVYNNTVHESKLGAHSAYDYLMMMGEDKKEYFLTDLIVKAIYHHIGGVRSKETLLVYESPKNRLIDTLDTNKILQESLCFYDRIASHFVP